MSGTPRRAVSHRNVVALYLIKCQVRPLTSGKLGNRPYETLRRRCDASTFSAARAEREGRRRARPEWPLVVWFRGRGPSRCCRSLTHQSSRPACDHVAMFTWTFRARVKPPQNIFDFGQQHQYARGAHAHGHARGSYQPQARDCRPRRVDTVLLHHPFRRAFVGARASQPLG